MLPHPSLLADDFEVVRDPLWNTIRLDPLAVRIIDTRTFQRLRHVKQLGHAFLVYPGATHTRFDHALGVYHLSRRTLQLLGDRGQLKDVPELDCRLIPYAALLHDIGHYPFSHALEELGSEQLSEHHEALAARFIEQPELAGLLQEIAANAAERIAALIRGRDGSPLQGLVAGSLDLDKIEYLNRDAMFCGVPYGTVDVDRLIHALAVVPDPASGALEVGIHEKGLSALESLLFAKYQMFRNVYWHHAVRAATALYKRTVQVALDAALISTTDLIGQTDEGVLTLLESRAAAAGDGARSAARSLDDWIPALRYRRLPKRALEISGEVLKDLPFTSWFYSRPDLRAGVENLLAAELGARQGEVIIDYPEKPRMMGLDLLLLQRSGTVCRLVEGGSAGLIDLPRIADELYHSARIFRVFAPERRQLDQRRVLDLLALQPAALEERVLSTSTA